MGHEISQFDIHDRQLMAGIPQPKAAIVTDLGEAKITRTFFGRARVRVVREQDRKRRAWLLAILTVTATAAAAWQGWIIFQKMQYVAPPVPLSERIQVSAPVFQPAHIAPDPHPSRRKSESLIQTEIDGLLSGPLPRHPPGWKPPEKPVAAKPTMATQSQAPTQSTAQTAAQTTPSAAAGNASMDAMDTQQPGKPSNATQPAATKPAATTAAATPQPATNAQTAATTPAAAPIANPLVKRDAAIPSSAGSIPHPVSAQD
jgi:hypothetical protein